MTLNDIMALILRYFTEFVYDVVVKSLCFLFAVSSPDEFLVALVVQTCNFADILEFSFEPWEVIQGQIETWHSFVQL